MSEMPPVTLTVTVTGRQGVAGSSAIAREALDAESRAWVQSLSVEGDERVQALERLYDLLLRAARRESHDDRKASERSARPPGTGQHQPLRIRSSPTLRVIFCASSHSSKGRT